MAVDGGPKEERKLKRMLAALRGNRKSKKVPKALIKQKEKFIDTMRMKQIKNAKATIKQNKQRLKEEH